MQYARDRFNQHSRWSDADQALLASLLAAGKSNRDIAIEMGRSRVSIRQRALLLGLVQPRPRRQVPKGS